MKTKMAVATIIMVFLAAMLTMAFSPVTTAHTETDPFVTDLIAAQTMDAGDVSVWNDGERLYVKYETDGDWCLTKTHLHVATALADIPQTGKGSPIPGHFDYSMEHDPCSTEYTYVIDLNGWTPTTELYIAAHAVVCRPGEGEPMFVQGVLTTVPMYTWADAINVGTVTVAIEGENLVVTLETVDGWLMLDTHLYLDPTTPPTWPPPWADFPYKNEGLGGVTADDYSISLPSLGVGCDDTLYISTHANLVKYTEWGAIYRDGWGDENPFDGWTKYFSVTIPCVPPELVCETAWGFGQRFIRKNWAMYFTYTVQ